MNDLEDVVDDSNIFSRSKSRGDPPKSYRADVESFHTVRVCREIDCPCRDFEASCPRQDDGKCLECLGGNETSDGVDRYETDAWFDWIDACEGNLKNCHKCPDRYADISRGAVAPAVLEASGCEYLVGLPFSQQAKYCRTSRNLCPEVCGHIKPPACSSLIKEFSPSLLYLKNLLNGENRKVGDVFPNFLSSRVNDQTRTRVQKAIEAKTVCDNLPELSACPTLCNMAGFRVIENLSPAPKEE